MTGIDAIEAVRQAVDRVEASMSQSIRVSTSRLITHASSAASRVSELEAQLRSTEADLHQAESKLAQMEHEDEEGKTVSTVLDHQHVGALQAKANNLNQELRNAKSRASSCQMRVDDFSIYASDVVSESGSICGHTRDFLRRLEDHVTQYGAHHG